MIKQGHQKVKLTLCEGSIVDAVAPVIVSASRSTDIPAFHLDWFFDRLNAGYCVWTNPFNKVKSYVSFQNTRCIVFWSKNPKALIPRIAELKDKGIDCYVQYTLNDYEAEGYEPNLPALQDRIDTFKKLVDTLGIGVVIWRYDPVLVTESVGLKEHLLRIQHIAKELYGFYEKMVFSFADISRYRKVQYNLNKAHIQYKELSDEGMSVFAASLSHLLYLKDVEIATCGEKIDLMQYGITKNRCVDYALMSRLFKDNTELIGWLNENSLTDPGQRKDCGCILSKDIGCYDTCGHGCVYCYANTTPEIGRRNCMSIKMSSNNDSLM